mgnify:CR=1 FL=1
MNIKRIVNEEIHRFLKEETEENGSVSSLVPDEIKTWNPVKDFKDGYSNGSDAVDGKMNNNSNNSNQSPTNMAGNALGGGSEGAAGGMEGMAGGAEGLAGGIEGAEMAAVAV